MGHFHGSSRALGHSDHNFKELIERREETLRLNPVVAYWHDAQEFEQAFDSGKKCIADGNYSQARNYFAQMAELYRGPYLEGYYQDWAIRRREQLELKAIDGLTRWSMCCLECRDGRGSLEAAPAAYWN